MMPPTKFEKFALDSYAGIFNPKYSIEFKKQKAKKAVESIVRQLLFEHNLNNRNDFAKLIFILADREILPEHFLPSLKYIWNEGSSPGHPVLNKDLFFISMIYPLSFFFNWYFFEYKRKIKHYQPHIDSLLESVLLSFHMEQEITPSSYVKNMFKNNDSFTDYVHSVFLDNKKDYSIRFGILIEENFLKSGEYNGNNTNLYSSLYNTIDTLYNPEMEYSYYSYVYGPKIECFSRNSFGFSPNIHYGKRSNHPFSRMFDALDRFIKESQYDSTGYEAKSVVYIFADKVEFGSDINPHTFLYKILKRSSGIYIRVINTSEDSLFERHSNLFELRSSTNLIKSIDSEDSKSLLQLNKEGIYKEFIEIMISPHSQQNYLENILKKLIEIDKNIR